MADTSPSHPDFDVEVPHSARIWNYWMGGKDNFAADREAGDAFVATYPDIVLIAKESRRFLIRAVRYLATDAGVHQFLDIGTGLPTMENTHEVAQRALLTNTTDDGVTAYVDGDFHLPDQIVADAKNVLNFNKPIAVMFMGVLGHVRRFDEVRSIVDRVMAAVPSGSYLVLWDGTEDKAGDEALEDYEETGAVAYINRTPEQIGSCFEGLELLEPGLVSISLWRPDPAEIDSARKVGAYGAVARKP
jgi:hypothetical protein